MQRPRLSHGLLTRVCSAFGVHHMGKLEGWCRSAKMVGFCNWSCEPAHLSVSAAACRCWPLLRIPGTSFIFSRVERVFRPERAYVRCFGRKRHLIMILRTETRGRLPLPSICVQCCTARTKRSPDAWLERDGNDPLAEPPSS